MDKTSPALRFPQTAEVFKSIEVDPDLVARVRARYPFLHDRSEDYSALGGRFVEP